jgi:hypothetical protein
MHRVAMAETRKGRALREIIGNWLLPMAMSRIRFRC